MQQSRTTFGLLASGLVIMTTGLVLARVPVPVADPPVAPPLFSTLYPFEYRNGAVDMHAPSVSKLESQFSALGYQWGHQGAHKNGSIPRVRLATFPSDLGLVARVSQKKRLFFQSMLPLILMENERILAHRARMQHIYATVDRGTAPSAADAEWLTQLGKRYQIADQPFAPEARKELETRVNTVPLSLALAMAANESAWGTSRFAREGNNLFGQWTFTPGTGLVPKNRPSGKRYEVAIFPDLAASVRGYLKNLNTHWAYEEFRRTRTALADLSSPEAGTRLARSLTRYSERGTDYTDDLVRIIKANGLTRFDAATLAPASTADS